ncbi:MAG TPA: peptidylprolyl isomerase [Bacteroidia bacterium]|mgnify:CR=1 FL=1|nr:peptidylprolyl isomerase [Bacteroidia bacterium]HRS58807.1 peptidylprolyl isomerase [Bacteroidia bacterium]HRU68131.1 peptidylprolyl isomerase [Bacteroidia bacterium]
MKHFLTIILAGFATILFLSECKEPPDPPKMAISHSVVNVSWKGGHDGSIDLQVTGGTPPYLFEWSNGAKTEDISELKAGTYTCIIKDSAWTETYSVTVAEPEKYEIWKISTSFGDIFCWLYNETPGHKANYLKLIRDGYFDSLIFHRVVKNFVIQGGDPTGTGTGGPGYDIPAEFHDSLTHVNGAIGAARLPDSMNPEKKSNGSQFYIVQNPNGVHYLDKNYTVFGIVVSGMNVVETIAQQPVNSSNRPLTNIYMQKVTIENFSAAELKNQFGFVVPDYNK